MKAAAKAMKDIVKAAAAGVGGALLLVICAAGAGVITGAFLGSAVWAVRRIGGF